MEKQLLVLKDGKSPWRKEYRQYPDGTHVCMATSTGDCLIDFGPEGDKQAEALADMVSMLPRLVHIAQQLKLALGGYLSKDESVGSTDNHLLKEADSVLDRVCIPKKKQTKGLLPIRDVIHFVDIDATHVKPETIDFLNTYYVMYRDQLDSMREDLVDVNSANETGAMSISKDRSVRRDIARLAKTAAFHDAAYVRFTND